MSRALDALLLVLGRRTEAAASKLAAALGETRAAEAARHRAAELIAEGRSCASDIPPALAGRWEDHATAQLRQASAAAQAAVEQQTAAQADFRQRIMAEKVMRHVRDARAALAARDRARRLTEQRTEAACGRTPPLR